ncbi:uncharacterized protein GIQ15_02816 [Arthroderma uncinatum]|uniref:uncharacterized protein n=1 Tax=Arthroderma uncinatum TaxID=74035 RepID=UPI00144A8E40|nr:uncharacterized protein GIQ15_02816 [Arthroderma uncinatum]KAF3483492.1 hypothetical protein GIQ15_02816 [Arthroderma uncinatum]
MLPSPSSCKSKGFLQVPSDNITEDGTFMLLTPETPGVERKRRIVDDEDDRVSLSDEDSDSDLDGSTLISNNFSKRARVSDLSDGSTSLEGSYASSVYDVDFEGSTLLDDRPLSGIGDSDHDTGDISSSGSDISSLSGGEESSFSDEEEPSTPGSGVEARESEREAEMLKAQLSTQLRRRNGSRYSNNTEEPYHPSPKIVDRNLSTETVHRDTHESDLSEDEIYNAKNSAKRGDKRDLDVEFYMEKAKRWAAAVEGPAGNWSDAEKDMYFRLAMRGFEAILPRSWKMDFMTLPDSLFATPGDHTAYLSCKNEFRGMRYFSDLVALGGRVRDRITCDLRPERTTKDAVNIMNERLIAVAKSYQSSWTLTPSIESRDSADSYFDIEQQYQDRTFPVITGFLICGSIVALMTLDSDPKAHPVFDTKTSGRLISRFNFSEYGQDVWNALAIAIAVAQIRKTIAQCEEEGKGDIMWMADQIPHLTDEDL